jgi:hypothetical protein
MTNFEMSLVASEARNMTTTDPDKASSVCMAFAARRVIAKDKGERVSEHETGVACFCRW